ncbi:MAG: hypothetical protein ACYTG6_00945 [Planctomycetota bacterium]
MKLPWPEIASSHRPEESVRRILDYICWITQRMQQVGFHGGTERNVWRERVHRAYAALFLPSVPGYGDPYPPDVPPPRNPGIWPDIPASRITGMTLRHQLKVVGMLAEQLRSRVWPHAREDEVQEWDRRFCLAREALDHGESVPVPEEALTEPSQAALDLAEAQEKAVRDHARKRSERLRQLKAQAARRKRAAAKAKAKSKKAATKKAAPKKKAVKKKATAKKAAQKKTAKKAAGAKAPASRAKKTKAAPKAGAKGKKAAGGRKKTARKPRRK